MDEKEILELLRQEKTYWWHIVRREILQSILARHAEFIFRHSGEAPLGLTPESYNNQSIRSWTRSGTELARMTDEGADYQNNPSYPPLSKGSPTRISLRLGERRGGVVNEDIKILDVGCGTGGNFAWLQDFGKVTGVDSSEAAVALANASIQLPQLERAPAFAGQAEDLPFEDSAFDLVTAFDVLEHVADEKRVLGEWGRVLCPRGVLFLSVPAYQWLFGPHDRALGHLRRYSLFQSRKILRDNNFKIIFSSYFFFFSFPVFISQRWLAKFSKRDTSQYVRVARWLNNFLIGLGKLEAAWLKIGVLPIGSSIVVLAQKNTGHSLKLSQSRHSGESCECEMTPESYNHKSIRSPDPPAFNLITNRSLASCDIDITTEGQVRTELTRMTDGMDSRQDDGEVTQGDKKETTPRFKIVKQFFKFAIVGLGNTTIDIGLLNLLIFWNWPVLWANTVAFIFAATNSFFLNKYWTFGDKEGKWHWQLPFYITVAVVGLGISNLFVYAGSIIWHWDINIVKIISIGAIFLWNFLAPKFLIFKK